MSGPIASAQAPASIPTSSDIGFEVASVKLNEKWREEFLHQRSGRRLYGHQRHGATAHHLCLPSAAVSACQWTELAGLGSLRHSGPCSGGRQAGQSGHDPRAAARPVQARRAHRNKAGTGLRVWWSIAPMGGWGHSSSRPHGTARRRSRALRVRAASTPRSTTPGEVWLEPASRWSSWSARLAASG